MQTLAQNGYASAEVLAALRGESGGRSLQFYYELLNSSHAHVDYLNNILSGSVAYDSLADIKRTGKFKIAETDQAIDFLSNRLKPWVRIGLPEKFGTYEEHVDSIPNNVVRWKFDEPEGVSTAANSGPAVFPLAIAAGVMQGVAPVIPGGTNAFDFPGGATPGVVTNVLSNNTNVAGLFGSLNQFSMSFWATLSDFSVSRSILRTQNTSNVKNFEIAFRKSSSLHPGRADVIEISFSVGGIAAYFESTSITSLLQIDQPIHIAFTWLSGNPAQIFFNGDNITDPLSTGGNPAGFLDAGPNMVIGGGTNSPWDGKLDDFMIWNQQLDQQIIFDLYQSGLQVGGYGSVNYAEWPQGVFILSTPKREIDEGSAVTRNIDAYDLLQVLADDKVLTRYFVNNAYLYTDAILELLQNTEGIPDGQWDIVTSSATTPAVLEWDAGTPKLTIINSMLSALNYRSLWFDENGRAQVRPYVLPEDRVVEYNYETDATSVIFPNAGQTLDFYNTPNVWVASVSDPDKPYLRAVYTNNDPASPTSTVNRGRSIVDFRTEDQAATQAILNLKVQRYAAEALSIFEQIEFDTALMPFHSDSDCYNFGYDKFGVESKYIETSWDMPLQAGASMSHSARRSVEIGGVLG